MNTLTTMEIVVSVGQLHRALGMRSGKIPNSAITASSSWDRYHVPWLARLKKHFRRPYANAWCAKVNNKYQWIQVYMGSPKKVKKIATQGRRDANQWVTKYYITFSLDGNLFIPYNCKKVRIGIPVDRYCTDKHGGLAILPQSFARQKHL